MLFDDKYLGFCAERFWVSSIPHKVQLQQGKPLSTPLLNSFTLSFSLIIHSKRISIDNAFAKNSFPNRKGKGTFTEQMMTLWFMLSFFFFFSWCPSFYLVVATRKYVTIRFLLLFRGTSLHACTYFFLTFL